jgi:hypothetical protein
MQGRASELDAAPRLLAGPWDATRRFVSRRAAGVTEDFLKFSLLARWRREPGSRPIRTFVISMDGWLGLRRLLGQALLGERSRLRLGFELQLDSRSAAQCAAHDHASTL